MNHLQPVTESHFRDAFEACQYVDGFAKPIVQTTWIYKGNPILHKIYDCNDGSTQFYAVSKSLEAKTP